VSVKLEQKNLVSSTNKINKLERDESTARSVTEITVHVVEEEERLKLKMTIDRLKAFRRKQIRQNELSLKNNCERYDEDRREESSVIERYVSDF
jgi:hypothetical protein